MSIFTHFISRGARTCTALMLGFSVMTGAVQAQVAAPQRPTQAPTTPLTADANAKALGERTCVCDVSCNGVSRSTSSPGPNGVIVTTPMRQACANKCSDWVQQNQAQWAREIGKPACNSMQCAGSSKLSTGDAIGVGPFNLNTSGFPACVVTPPANCCPEFTKAITPGNLASMFTESQHGMGQPYSMTFGSNGAFSNAFEGYLKEWANWLNIDGCKGVTGFSITYQLFNTNSTVKPTGPNPPAGSTGPAQSQTVSYVNGVVSPPSYVWNIPASPNWWFVKATVTPIDQNGKPVICPKTAGCMDRIYTGWIDDAMTAAKLASGNAAWNITPFT